MRIEVEAGQDICILRHRGRPIAGSYGERVRAQEKLEAAGCRKVIADCREALYFDAACLGFIAGLYKRLRDSGGQLVLVHVHARNRALLRITRLDEVIPIFDDEEIALAALKEPRAACPAEDLRIARLSQTQAGALSPQSSISEGVVSGIEPP